MTFNQSTYQYILLEWKLFNDVFIKKILNFVDRSIHKAYINLSLKYDRMDI
jgi:hypothetical protein